MAGIISRTVFAGSLTRRTPILFTFRGVQHMMADPLEHATGLERKELEAIARGNDNPFNMRAMKRGVSTKANPTLVPSFFDARLIGCICHEDAFHINYMWLHKGEPKRCECGCWYKLVEAEDPFDFSKK